MAAIPPKTALRIVATSDGSVKGSEDEGVGGELEALGDNTKDKRVVVPDIDVSIETVNVVVSDKLDVMTAEFFVKGDNTTKPLH